MTEKLKELEKLLIHKKSKSYYAKRLNISELEVEKLLQQLHYRKAVDEEYEEKIEENLDRGTLKATKFTDKSPKSPEEVIEIHGIDTSKWKLSSYWSKQKGKKWVVSALFTAKSPDVDLQSQKDTILNEIKKYSPTRSIRSTEKLEHEPDCLLEIAIPDLHIGKHAWIEEVREDYDLQIAENRIKDAVIELLSRINTNKVERILFPVGNDLINVDNEQGTTTAGTAQDCDSRFAKMVKITRKVLVEVIDCLSDIAPVDIPIVVGNHDQVTSFMIGEILDAFYHNNPSVNIENRPTWRKYYQYYDNGFQFTHGNNEKHSDLGLIFATEEPKLWADTKYRFCQLGHYHKSKTINYVSVDSHTGFQVQILPSLSSTDYWHSSKGYLSNKQAKAFLYHKTKGEIASYTYTV